MDQSLLRLIKLRSRACNEHRATSWVTALNSLYLNGPPPPDQISNSQTQEERRLPLLPALAAHDSFRGTGRHSKNPQVHLQRDVGQPVGSAKPSGSQWTPATALQSMASSPFPRGVASAARATASAEAAPGREPSGWVFWSVGFGPQAPWQERAAGPRLRGSAKNRHCLSMCLRSSLPC